MNVIKGDLIRLAQNNYFDVIIHGCNCFCTMGAGIAKQIAKSFPEAYRADLATEKGDRSKLGSISVVRIMVNNSCPLTIINAYTQYSYSRHGVDVDYNAIQQAFTTIKKEYGNMGFCFGFPMIGAGLAGGDWGIISNIIEKAMYKENMTLVKYKGK